MTSVPDRPLLERGGGDRFFHLNVMAPLSLYVHWPYCRSKCGYCDFNSHPGDDPDHVGWLAALLSEMVHCGTETNGRRVVSIFFGGGTPSLLPPAAVAAVLDAVAGQWPVDSDAEITLEANPNAADVTRLRGYRAAGVNRLSLGVQSFDDRALAFLGRSHSAADALRAIASARETFPRFSFDLIYALPGETPADWRRSLKKALPVAGDHVSLYQLTVEPGTGFAETGVNPADEETAAALFELTQELTAAAGICAYEVSNHARPGGECRHNLAVWRGGDYLGLGPGAHGRLTIPEGVEAHHRLRDPIAWRDAVATRGHGTAGRMLLSPRQRADERVILGLRLTEGVAQSGLDLSRHGVAAMIEAGFLEEADGRLRTTAAGRLCLNAVLREILV